MKKANPQPIWTDIFSTGKKKQRKKAPRFNRCFPEEGGPFKNHRWDEYGCECIRCGEMKGQDGW